MIDFSTKRNEIFYSISVWNKEGTNLALIKTGKYDGEEPESLISFLTDNDVEK